MIKKALYAGSFDPITKGHLDIIIRSIKLTDELIIAILYNMQKTNYWFSVDERISMIRSSLLELNVDISKIKIISYDGLLVDLVKKENIDVLIRGLRALSDYEYEVQLYLTNNLLSTKSFETIFLNSNRQYMYLSSSLVKEVAINKGNIDHFVCECVKNEILKKLGEKNGKI